MHYWCIRTKKPSTNTYIKTNQKHIPEMIVDIAVRDKMFCEAFMDVVESVTEITQEEYFKHMWE